MVCGYENNQENQPDRQISRSLQTILEYLNLSLILRDQYKVLFVHIGSLDSELGRLDWNKTMKIA